MVNVFPPDHVDDLPDPTLAIPEAALFDENEEPEEEEEFKDEEEFEEGEPQEEEYDIEFEDAVEVEDTVELEDDTVLKSVHEVGESSTATFHKEDDDSLLPGFMRRDINSLFDLGNEVRSCMEEGAVAMENLVRKLGDAEERIECKKLKKELEDARGVVFEEISNEAIDVPVEDEKSPSSEPRGSPRDS
ncbi:hypothetical protein Tco_1366620 [Tanacetum coccineum]